MTGFLHNGHLQFSNCPHKYIFFMQPIYYSFLYLLYAFHSPCSCLTLLLQFKGVFWKVELGGWTINTYLFGQGLPKDIKVRHSGSLALSLTQLGLLQSRQPVLCWFGLLHHIHFFTHLYITDMTDDFLTHTPHLVGLVVY